MADLFSSRTLQGGCFFSFHLRLAAITVLALLVLVSPGRSGGARAAGATITLDPLTLLVFPSSAGSTELAPLLDVNIHFTRDERRLDAARGAGFTW